MSSSGDVIAGGVNLTDGYQNHDKLFIVAKLYGMIFSTSDLYWRLTGGLVLAFSRSPLLQWSLSSRERSKIIYPEYVGTPENMKILISNQIDN